MSLFNSRRPEPPIPAAPKPPNGIPVTQIDLDKRYDVYCVSYGEERLYENVRFIGIRTFDRITEYSSYVSGYLEIEAVDGLQVLIPTYGIQLICEHGKQPVYKVIRQWGDNW